MTLTGDERIAFVTGSDNGSDYTIRHATRPSSEADFSAPATDQVVSTTVGVAGVEAFPSTTTDGKSLYFSRTNSATFTTTITVATRGMTNDLFGVGATVMVDGVALTEALHPYISRSGMTLYWLDETDLKLRSAARGAGPAEFFQRKVESSIPIGGGAFAISADELTLFYGGTDIISSARTAKNQQFGAGAAVTTVNSDQLDQATFVSDDDCLLFIASQRAGGLGGYNIWVARRGM